MTIIPIPDNVVSVSNKKRVPTGPPPTRAGPPGPQPTREGQSLDARTWVRTPPSRDEAISTPGAGSAVGTGRRERRYAEPERSCHAEPDPPGLRSRRTGQHDRADRRRQQLPRRAGAVRPAPVEPQHEG